MVALWLAALAGATPALPDPSDLESRILDRECAAEAQSAAVARQAALDAEQAAIEDEEMWRTWTRIADLAEHASALGDEPLQLAARDAVDAYIAAIEGSTVEVAALEHTGETTCGPRTATAPATQRARGTAPLLAARSMQAFFDGSGRLKPPTCEQWGAGLRGEIRLGLASQESLELSPEDLDLYSDLYADLLAAECMDDDRLAEHAPAARCNATQAPPPHGPECRDRPGHEAYAAYYAVLAERAAEAAEVATTPTAGYAPCPRRAARADRFDGGQHVAIIALHPDDAYFGSEDLTLPLAGRVDEDLHNNGECWFGGSFIDTEGNTYYFYKAAVVPTEEPQRKRERRRQDPATP